MFRWLVVLAIVVMVLPLPAFSQQTEPATQPASAVDAETMARAEAKLLRRLVEQQREEIAALRGQIAQLTEQLKSLGIAPAVDASGTDTPSTTQPAEKQTRRVVFVLLSGAGRGEIEQAIAELSPEQWFNIVVPGINEVVPFQPQLVQPTDRNKQKIPEFLKGLNYIIDYNWPHGMESAVKWRPDVIWIVGRLRSDDENGAVAEIHKINAGAKARINTTAAFTYNSKESHLLWRISHETGGVCVDKSGQPIDEPVLPIPAPKPAEPARKPSILRENP